MSDKAKIYAAFVKAQRAFAPALKTSSNPHFKSKYADLSACVEAVIDGLNENGIGLIQRTYEDASGVTVETLFVHESGESMEGGKLHVPAARQDPQGYGSALTYARRYSLMAACGIAPEDDDGNAASAKPPQPRQQKKPEPVSVPALVSAMEACHTLEGLKATFAQAWKDSGHSPDVKASYDSLKSKFEQKQGEPA